MRPLTSLPPVGSEDPGELEPETAAARQSVPHRAPSTWEIAELERDAANLPTESEDASEGELTDYDEDREQEFSSSPSPNGNDSAATSPLVPTTTPKRKRAGTLS